VIRRATLRKYTYSRVIIKAVNRAQLCLLALPQKSAERLQNPDQSG